MGNSRRVKGFPCLMHVSGELREGSPKVGDNYVYENGQLTSIDIPPCVPWPNVTSTG